MKTHKLYDESDNLIFSTDKFDKEVLRSEIIKYLANNADGEVSHETDEDYIINIYCNNRLGQPCRIVTKGSKEFYKRLEDK
jgi:hypothetical protein